MNDTENKNGYEAEDITEEILNNLFFQDFVFRSPKKKDKYNKELADVMVCFDDVMLVVQIKKQVSKKDPVKWSEKNIEKAVSQVTGAVNSINEKEIDCLSNDRIGKINLCRTKYEYIYGLIIVDQESEPYDVSEYVKEAHEKYNVSIQIMSLKDFYIVCRLFDTAEEFFHYYDVRNAVKGSETIRIHDERAFTEYFVNNFCRLSCDYVFKKGGDSESYRSSFLVAQKFYKKKFCDDFIEDYVLSLKIDELIDRMHKKSDDSENYVKKLAGNVILEYAEIAHELAKTGRMTRIMHGKEIFKQYEFLKQNPKEEPLVSIKSISRATEYIYYFPNYLRKSDEVFGFLMAYGTKNIKESKDINAVICSAIMIDPEMRERYFFAMKKR